MSITSDVILAIYDTQERITTRPCNVGKSMKILLRFWMFLAIFEEIATRWRED